MSQEGHTLSLKTDGEKELTGVEVEVEEKGLIQEAQVQEEEVEQRLEEGVAEEMRAEEEKEGLGDRKSVV